ncbi:low affinity Fe/Cu permease [Tahibacter aquaticus]|jgi:low affinity Fe/Cu permease|uniref:Low affinity Fe/Cu permease n=1 Tax=Tahibacter aquaticus TaxID=520092 RepID=A0A4R6Z797_9GAMM|nr:low affinity iron permease family protein [Tahibacter aquaticus]TDR47635.1 low affinity Fe/Cu permease [Tahibacter aquaticus]
MSQSRNNDPSNPMPQLKRGKRHSWFDRAAGAMTHAVGTPAAFGIALGSIVVWAATGPLFGYSETWQLIVNTATTIITFLMVFLIQQAQNKDSLALHLKLNELLASHRSASNRLVAIEDLDEVELATLRKFYCRLAELAQKRGVHETHSLDEAIEADEEKRQGRERSL